MDNILIINYDLNNITSVSNALKKIGHNPIISSDPSKLKSAAKIILPGVGSFDSAIKILENYGWKDRLREFVEKYSSEFEATTLMCYNFICFVMYNTNTILNI